MKCAHSSKDTSKQSGLPSEGQDTGKQSGLSSVSKSVDKPSLLTFDPRPQRGATRLSSAIDTAQMPRLQNLTLAELSKQSGLKLLPVVLLQTSASNDGLIRIWPEPSVDADKNVGYAVQWFGFATICLIALIVFGWRARRRG